MPPPLVFLSFAEPRDPGPVRDEPQRGLNVEVAAFEVVKRESHKHIDRAILLGTRLRCRDDHVTNPAKILIAFIRTSEPRTGSLGGPNPVSRSAALCGHQAIAAASSESFRYSFLVNIFCLYCRYLAAACPGVNTLWCPRGADAKASQTQR
jgi:hypothetical protein